MVLFIQRSEMYTMNYKKALGLGLGSALIAGFSCSTGNRKDTGGEEMKKPNIVIIYADDLGYGDIGCFGATDIKTPNIDSIASQGIRFTEFYSASPICSPSRAGLLTGRMPQRTGIDGVFFPDSYTGLPTDEITIANILKKQGYATGIVGKWHLGHREKYLPLQRGFDEYFGIPYSNDMESVVYMDGNDVVDFYPDQHYITRTYTQKALNFIDRHKDKPFFLYLAHNMPHVPIYASEKFIGTSERGLYGDVIQELDWSVGQVMAELEKDGLKDNTLLIFSSDNGPWLVMRDLGGSAGKLREGKQYTFEGGMRVPTMAMWPGKIKPGSVYDDMALMVDWFPTLTAISGGGLPSRRAYDGENILPVLTGKAKRKGDKYLYFDNEYLQCYRHGDWKVKKAFEGTKPVSWRKPVRPHPVLLINLKEDPGEKNNLAARYPERLKQMLAEMDSMYHAMGKLPPPLVMKTNSDNSEYEYLEKKYGKEYYNFYSPEE